VAPHSLGAVLFPPARNGRSLGASVADYARHRVAFVRSLDRGAGAGARFDGSARAVGGILRLAVQQAPYPRLDGVSSSILVLHARNDHLVPVDFAIAASRRAGWALNVLARGGHSAHVHEPELWLRALTPWLQAVGGGSFGSG
jgi:pimeloyl-ACP methyl ester carboxylesterase